MPAGPRTYRRFARATGLLLVAAVCGGSGAAVASAGNGGAEYGSSTVEAHATSARMEKIADCESGGDPTLVDKTGVYRGKYMFTRDAWKLAGGKGDPAKAPESEQDKRAVILMKKVGPSAWPNCA